MNKENIFEPNFVEQQIEFSLEGGTAISSNMLDNIATLRKNRLISIEQGIAESVRISEDKPTKSVDPHNLKGRKIIKIPC